MYLFFKNKYYKNKSLKNQKNDRMISQISIFPVVLILAVFLSGCGGNGLRIETQISEEQSSGEQSSEEKSDQISETGSDLISEEKMERASGAASSQVVVYLCGAVVMEGLYSLEKGSRVGDALELAGGFAGDAARDYVNLARILTDGEMIYFPTEKEAADGSAADKSAGPDAGESGVSGERKEDSDSRIDINTADISELTTLPGIGETRAKDILDYREKNGGFKKPEDLMKVPGIKEGTFNKLKDLIKVQ